MKKSYTCDVCNKTFSFLLTINVHIESVHEGQQFIIYISIFQMSSNQRMQLLGAVFQGMPDLTAEELERAASQFLIKKPEDDKVKAPTIEMPKENLEVEVNSKKFSQHDYEKINNCPKNDDTEQEVIFKTTKRDKSLFEAMNATQESLLTSFSPMSSQSDTTDIAGPQKSASSKESVSEKKSEASNFEDMKNFFLNNSLNTCNRFVEMFKSESGEIDIKNLMQKVALPSSDDANQSHESSITQSPRECVGASIQVRSIQDIIRDGPKTLQELESITSSHENIKAYTKGERQKRIEVQLQNLTYMMENFATKRGISGIKATFTEEQWSILEAEADELMPDALNFEIVKQFLKKKKTFKVKECSETARLYKHFDYDPNYYPCSTSGNGSCLYNRNVNKPFICNLCGKVFMLENFFHI